MIVTGDIYKILCEQVRDLGIEAVYDGWNPVRSELKEEAVVIVTSTPIEPDVRWEKAFVHVNICVPDYLGQADTATLNERERLAAAWIRDHPTGVSDGTRYRLSRSSLGIERDDTLKCSYVNLKILFEILNVM